MDEDRAQKESRNFQSRSKVKHQQQKNGSMYESEN